MVVDNTTDLVTVKTLAVGGDSTPDEGDTVIFNITVTNSGPITATNVSLTDSLPSGITFVSSSTTQGNYDTATGLFDIGTLNVGQTATLTLEGIVDAGQTGNTITNMTTAATGDQADTDTTGDDLNESVIVGIPAANLVTVKTLVSGDATPDEGDTVTFQIVVTNNGPDTATNVSLIDQLPAGLTYVSDTSAGGTYDPTTGLWTIGNLANGATATITISATVDVGQAGNPITNITSAASGDQPDPDSVGDDLEETVTVNDAADLVTVKTLVVGGDSTPAEGDTVTYQITVTNNGGAQATNVSLIDQLPAGLTYVGDTSAGGTYDPATGLWTIGTLNVGDTATITISATVDAGQAGTTINNVTTAATGDQMDPSMVGDDLEEAVVVDNTTNLVTVKTLASGDATPIEGDTVTFDITVTNSGPLTATNVSLTDFLPVGLTATGNNGVVTQGSYDFATGVFDIGTLNVGQTATLTLEGTVNAGQSGNTITNTTTAATGDQVDTDTTGDDLNESVIVGAIFDPLFDVTTADDGTTSGNPPNLIGVPPLFVSSIGNFLGAPGPIYAGIPTNTTNPVTLESNRPITGGFSVDNGIVGDGSIQSVEQGEFFDANPQESYIFEEFQQRDNNSGETIDQGPADFNYQGPGEVIHEGPIEIIHRGPAEIIHEETIHEGPVESIEEGPIEIIEDGLEVQFEIPFEDTTTEYFDGTHDHLQQPSFLQRMRNFLSR